LRRGLPAILIISLLHAGLLFLLLPVVLPIAMFIACAAGLAAAVALSRWSFYRQEDFDEEPDRIFFRDEPEPDEGTDGSAGKRPRMSLLVAFAPYIFLGVIALVVLTVTPIRSALET